MRTSHKSWIVSGKSHQTIDCDYLWVQSLVIIAQIHDKSFNGDRSNMAEGPCFGSLEDKDILGIGHKITDCGILRQLAYAGLKLNHLEVEPIVTNKQNDIQSAAHELLSKWRRKQNSGEEAFCNLHVALKECQLEMFAEELTGKRDQEQHPKEVLKDEHIHLLSTRITNKGELSKLAYRGLKLEIEDVESALSNNPNDIQSAAHKVLRTWLQKQTKITALGALHTALQECGMKGLSDELIKGVDGSKGPSQLSQGSTYKVYYSLQHPQLVKQKYVQ